MTTHQETTVFIEKRLQGLCGDGNGNGGSLLSRLDETSMSLTPEAAMPAPPVIPQNHESVDTIAYTTMQSLLQEAQPLNDQLALAATLSSDSMDQIHAEARRTIQIHWQYGPEARELAKTVDTQSQAKCVNLSEEQKQQMLTNPLFLADFIIAIYHIASDHYQPEDLLPVNAWTDHNVVVNNIALELDNLENPTNNPTKLLKSRKDVLGDHLKRFETAIFNNGKTTSPDLAKILEVAHTILSCRMPDSYSTQTRDDATTENYPVTPDSFAMLTATGLTTERLSLRFRRRYEQAPRTFRGWFRKQLHQTYKLQQDVVTSDQLFTTDSTPTIDRALATARQERRTQTQAKVDYDYLFDQEDTIPHLLAETIELLGEGRLLSDEEDHTGLAATYLGDILQEKAKPITVPENGQKQRRLPSFPEAARLVVQRFWSKVTDINPSILSDPNIPTGAKLRLSVISSLAA